MSGTGGRGPGKLGQVQTNLWTLPFASEQTLYQYKDTERTRNTDIDPDKIITYNPDVDVNSLKVLIGNITKKDETEEQLLNAARKMIPTLTDQEWSRWCKLITGIKIQQKIEQHMHQSPMYDSIQNMSYIIKKIIKQDINEQLIGDVNTRSKWGIN